MSCDPRAKLGPAWAVSRLLGLPVKPSKLPCSCQAGQLAASLPELPRPTCFESTPAYSGLWTAACFARDGQASRSSQPRLAFATQHGRVSVEPVSAQVAQVKPKLKTRPAKPKSKLPDLTQRTLRF